jgi:hypothetical protein
MMILQPCLEKTWVKLLSSPVADGGVKSHSITIPNPIEHYCVILSLHVGSSAPLSASMIAFYNVMLQFVNNICLIGSLTLYSRIVDSVAILFKAFVNRTIQVYEERGMTDDQRAVVNSNFQFISESFISRVIVQLRHQFDRPIPELEVVREELGGN